MIEWVITSVVLIAVVVLLRQLLKGRISLRVQYALWALVLIRLLVPITFGESKISVMNAVSERQTQQIEYQTDITLNIPPSWTDYVEPDLAPVEPDPTLPEEEQQEQYEKNQQQWQDEMDAAWEKYKEENTTTVTVELEDILLAVWCAGMAVVGVCFLVSNLRFWFRLRRSRCKLEIADCPLPVYCSEAMETPCLFGLFRPAVYVTPAVAGNETALAHVLAHETTHYRHWDHIWAVLRCLCLALHWYDPLVWLAASLSRRDAELACDEGALRRIGEGERVAYGHTLISLTCTKRGGLLHTATTMTGSKKSIKERIKLIAQKPKMAIYTLIAVILIAAIAVGCTFTGAEESGGMPEWLPDITAEELVNVGFNSISEEDTLRCTLPSERYEELVALFHGVTEANCRADPDGLSGLTAEGCQMTIQRGSELWSFICREEDQAVILTRSLATSSYSGPGGTYIIDSPELYAFIVTNVKEFGISVEKIYQEQEVPQQVWEYADTIFHEYWNKMMEGEPDMEILSIEAMYRGVAGADFDVPVYKVHYRVDTEWGDKEFYFVDAEWGDKEFDLYLAVLWENVLAGSPDFIPLGYVDLLTLQSVYGTLEMEDRYDGDQILAFATEALGAYQEGQTLKERRWQEIPMEVVNYAESLLDEMRDEFNAAELSDVVALNLGCADEDSMVLVYRADVRLGMVNHYPNTGLLADWYGGTSLYIVALWEGMASGAPTFTPLGYGDYYTMDTVYGTPEMLAKYGDAIFALASEQMAAYPGELPSQPLGYFHEDVSFEASNIIEAVRTYATEYVPSLVTSEPESLYSVKDRAVLDWELMMVSDDSRAFTLQFDLAFLPDGNHNWFALRGVQEGEGDYEGWYIWRRQAIVELQEDGLWHCRGIASGTIQLASYGYAKHVDAIEMGMNAAAHMPEAIGYALFDVHHDNGPTGIVVETGKTEADRTYHFYICVDHDTITTGTVSAAHSYLAHEGDELTVVGAHMGEEWACRLHWESGQIQPEELYRRYVGEDEYTQWDNRLEFINL